jgi:acyl carrier protein
MDDVRERLKETIAKALELKQPPETIKGDHLIEELGISSVDALEVLIWVENDFGVQIADEDLSQELVDSLDKLAAYVEARTEAQVAS